MGPMWRVAIDTGGTFTDAYFFDETTGKSHVAKVPSIPAAPEQAVMQSLRAGGVEPRDIAGTCGVSTSKLSRERQACAHVPSCERVSRAKVEEISGGVCGVLIKLS